MFYLLAAALPGRAQEAGTTAAPFLLQDFGARAAAMGGAATGGPDAQDALYYNPAALAITPRKTLALQHIEEITGDNYEQIGYIHPFGERFGIGVSANYVYFVDAVRTEFTTLDEFTNYDLALGLSAAYRVSSRLAIGGTAKFIEEKLFKFKASTATFDLGLLYQTPIEGLTLGLVRKDMGGSLAFVEEAFPIAVPTRFGFAYAKPKSPWRFTGDAVYIRDQKPRFGYGAERKIDKYLALRAGYRHNYDGRAASGFTAGLSLRYENISFDYAYIPSVDLFGLGGSHRIQSVLEFGATREPWLAYGAPARDTSPIRAPGLRLRSDTSTVPAPPADPESFSRFHGTMTASLRTTEISNPRIINRVPGWRPQLEVFSTGMVGKTEATLASNIYWDDWDRLRIKRVTADLRSDELAVTAGDFVADLSRYTIASRNLRGARAQYTIEREKRSPKLPPGEVIRGTASSAGSDGTSSVPARAAERVPAPIKPVNIGRLLREQEFGRENFRTTTVRAVAGQSAEPLNVQERTPELNNVRATFGIFEQFTYGAEVTSEVVHNTEVTLRTAHVADDPLSLYFPGVTLPISNTAISTAVRHDFSSGLLALDAELGYSIYDRNAFSDLTEKKRDVGWFVRGLWTPADWGIEAVYEYLGPEYDLGGNIAMRSLRDRKGPRIRVTSPSPASPSRLALRLRFDGQTYEDNLDLRKNFTTRVTDGGGGVDFIFPGNITVNAGWRHRTDRSDLSRDTVAAIQRLSLQNNIYNFGARLPWGRWAVLANYATSVTRNESAFAPGVDFGGFAISTWSANVTGPLFRNSDLTFRYLRTVSRFEIPVSRRVYEQIGARVNVNGLIKSRLDLFGNFNATTNRGVAQIEFAREFTAGARWRFSPEKSFELQYQHLADHFNPADTTLDYDADVLEMRYTALF